MNSSSASTEITICVNDQSLRVAEGTTIEALLRQLKINSPAVAVELNLEIQPRNVFPHRVLSEGDQLEIVTLVGGG